MYLSPLIGAFLYQKNPLQNGGENIYNYTKIDSVYPSGKAVSAGI